MQSAIRTHCADEVLVKERRAHIALCSTKLLCKKGFNQTSIREIATACNMSIGNLYHYVGTKEDILFLMLERGLSDMKEVADLAAQLTERPPVDALKVFLKVYIERIHSIRDIFLFFYQETKNLDERSRRSIFESEGATQDAIGKILERGVSTGVFRIDNVGLVARNIIIIGQAWAFRRWSLGRRFTVEEYIKEQTNYIFRSILTSSDKNMLLSSM
ncbi:MAG: TetR/AcrR family transcriptional regulator [Dehalococcoidia bacterium]|nr:TetR/AcrR family transcriptional regulator [Dehalococcoidia bacterium]